MANKHLIGKQIIDIEVNSSDKIYAMQQKVSELVWKDLLPMLTTMFDRIVGEDEVISLNRIELDIGHINLNNRAQIIEIVDKIIKLLEKTIEERVKNLSIHKNGFKVKNENQNDKTFDLKKDVYHRKQKENLEHYSKEKRTNREHTDNESKLEKNNRQLLRRYYFDLWLYWLEKGRLPSYTIEPTEDWMPLILETLGIDIDAVTILENKLREYPIALKRLVLQHTGKDLKSIVELYTGFSQTKLLDLCKEIKDLSKNQSAKSIPIDDRVLEINIWQYIFKEVILGRKKLESISLGIAVMKQPFMTFLFKETVNIKVIKTETDYPFLQAILEKVPQVHEKEKEISLLKDDDEIDDGKDGFLEIEDAVSNEEELETPQFFNNAGVVLLHPFLSSFYRKLGLLGEKDFIDFKAQSKAVVLLHFLATAKEDPKEYEMVLPKFLCQMPVNIPLDHSIKLTKEEKVEANNLLQAVIEHWGVLGGTSPDGLREGFLMREGKLEKEQTGWKLFVEQKTLDILLDRLPWNLGLIKLPWMKEILKVEWR
ncbi:contractile injection system tape measure protein [Aquimarina mytili]|uniref:Uncharacterized protein n=1 Tax=Aquimarina mytili TaxID=874423 RepID=A0A936ZX25_9FLAO|nr:contractile injection system tape measure protein [Aquimarina mytili]MBL0683841.1 hypothetical protein [Aquimarina mytili]